jgi:hypothetical protein
MRRARGGASLWGGPEREALDARARPAQSRRSTTSKRPTVSSAAGGINPSSAASGSDVSIMKPEVAVDLRRQRLAKKAGAETRRRLVVVAAGHDVLDVAAGNGNVAIAAARRRLVACDLTSTVWRRRRRRQTTSLLCSVALEGGRCRGRRCRSTRRARVQ